MKIAACCKRLRLRQMTDYLDRVSEADAESFLLRLPELEVQHRDRARVERGIKNAGFYIPKSLEDFLFDEVTFPAQLTREKLLGLEFLPNRQNLYGNVGTGETHLATAGHRGLYNGGDLHGFLKRLEKPDLLMSRSVERERSCCSR